MPDVREVYEMVTKQKAPDPGALERQQKRQVRTARNRRFGALAVAAAIGLVAVVLFATTRSTDDATPVADAPIDTTASAKAVATGFLDAYGAFDADAAASYLADDVDLSGFPVNKVGRLPLLTSWLEAEGYQQSNISCDAVEGSSETFVDCFFDFHAIRSEEIGRGPYTGSTFDFTVRDGEIVSVSKNWDTDIFSPQMWEPFAKWVSTTYPEDAAVMYTNKSLSGFRLTEESIRLWEQRTKEYVKGVQQGTIAP